MARLLASIFGANRLETYSIVAVERIRSLGNKICAFGHGWGLTILAHAIFGAAAIYFCYLFFPFDPSFALIRNLGIAVTLWASLGIAFNFAVAHARSVEPWFSGLNVIILGASVLLCLVAMANHRNLLIHVVVIHLVLTLAATWSWIASGYYASRSNAWHKWYSDRFAEDAIAWVSYLCAAYLPFYLPPLMVILRLTGQNDLGHPLRLFEPSNIEAASDGVTAVILFTEFFKFWYDANRETAVAKRHFAEIIAQDEPELPDDILARVLSTGRVRIGCLSWAPVVDCHIVPRSVGGSSPKYELAGFYGKWASTVAAHNKLIVECVPVAWHNMRQNLRTGGVDFIVCAFSTETRKQYAAFTRPYHQCAMTAVARDGSRVWDVETIKSPDVRIVIAKNEVGFEFAKSILNFDPEHRDARPHFTVVETDRIEEVASIVLGGGQEYIGIADALRADPRS